VTDFERYAVAPGKPLLPDLFVGEPFDPARLRR
jgi:hypothetical protein